MRFISNPSSGKMGFCVAEEAVWRGAEVTLIAGPVTAPKPCVKKYLPVVSAQEMCATVLRELKNCDVLIMAAAVADQKPVQRVSKKVKKGVAPEIVELVRTPDILLAVAEKLQSTAKKPLRIGFAAETEKLEIHAEEKLKRKQLDLIVGNWVGQGGSGFESSGNRGVLIAKNGRAVPFETGKRQLAAQILDFVATRFNG